MLFFYYLYGTHIFLLEMTSCSGSKMNDTRLYFGKMKRPLWSWTYDSWFFNSLCTLVCITTKVASSNHAHVEGYSIQLYVIKVSQWLDAAQWFSLATLVSSTNKTDCCDITKIFLKVMLNTIIPLVMTHEFTLIIKCMHQMYMYLTTSVFDIKQLTKSADNNVI